MNSKRCITGLAIIVLLFRFTVKSEISNECNEKQNYLSVRKTETRILLHSEISDADLNGLRPFVRNYLEKA